MTTQPVSSSSPNQLKTNRKELKTDDFIRMMLTQLQHQDPLQPASNQELMQQMAQISSLQSSTMLQDTLKDLAVQSQIGSAGNLIGKMVEGLDEENEKVSGVVASVRVQDNKAYLELENGKTVPLSNVTAVAAAPGQMVAAGTPDGTQAAAA